MKKVLSWVLALALVLSSFSMAFAADTAKQGKDLSDINGNANYDAIVANCDLGIITGYEDGTYQPAKSVNRAEYAALITRMLDIPESALKAYDANQFSDMSGYGWATGYVGFCAAKGIIEGYGDGTFKPGETITLNEAMTMTLRAVGYISTSSELVGNWPSNYVTLGKRLSLYDDVAVESTVDRASAAQVIYNTLTVYPVAVNKDGDTTKAYYDNGSNRYKTVLEVYHDCNVVAGGDSDGFKVYTYASAQNSVVNTMDYVGSYVKAFENSDGDVVAIAEVKSTLLTGEFNSDGTKFKVGNKEYTVNSGILGTTMPKSSDSALTPGGPTYFDNMTNTGYAYAVTATIESGSTTADAAAKRLDGDDTYTLAVDLSGNKIKDIYSVTKWTANDTFLYEKDMLDTDDNKLNGWTLPENDDENIDTNMFVLNGATSLDKIAVDNVIEVYCVDNGVLSTAEVVKINVGAKTVNGKVSKVKDSDYTIDGTVYTLADNHDGTPSLGDKGTAYLNYDGDIYKWDKNSGSSENFAIVLGAKNKGTNGIDNGEIKLLTKEGKEVKYTIDDDCVFVVKHGSPTVSSFDTHFVAGSFVTFDTNKDGEVDELKRIKYGSNPWSFNSVTDWVNVDDVSGVKCAAFKQDKLSKSETVFAGVSVDSSAVVFTVDNSDYGTAKVSDLDKDDAFCAYLVLNDDGKIAAFVVDGKAAKNTDYVYAVVNSISTAENADGDKVQFVEGFADGKKFEAYTDDSNTIAAAEVKKLVETTTDATKVYGAEGYAPALAVFDVDSDGVITELKAVVSKNNEQKFGSPLVPYFDDTNGIFGAITKKDGTDFTVHLTSPNATNVYPVDSNAYVYQYDTVKDEYVVKTVSTLKKGDSVSMWQIDEDSEYYDVVLFTR